MLCDRFNTPKLHSSYRVGVCGRCKPLHCKKNRKLVNLSIVICLEPRQSVINQDLIRCKEKLQKGICFRLQQIRGVSRQETQRKRLESFVGKEFSIE